MDGLIDCPFVIATSARAGGNFLMDLLTSTGVVGDVKERLQEYRLRDSQVSDAEVTNIFDTVYQLSKGKDSWGMKVDYAGPFCCRTLPAGTWDAPSPYQMDLVETYQ